MSTSAFASAIFPLPIDHVWSYLRNFLWPVKLLESVIEAGEMEEGKDEHAIGAIRKLKWKTGEVCRHRLLELSEQFYILSWELVDSVPHSEVSAIISRIRCRRITEKNHTLVEWTAEYSADVTQSLILFEQKSFMNNLQEMRNKMTNFKIPTLYHMHEGPSTRILWLSYELGILINIEEATPEPNVDLRSSKTELPTSKGGAVTSFVEKEHNLTLYESGAILTYLLEKHSGNELIPKTGTKERVLYHKFFFFAASTTDHLLFHSYKHMYVVNHLRDSQSIVDENKEQWDSFVAPEFEKQLKLTKFVCGDNFTAADIMAGWSFWIANTLGWLDHYPHCEAYLKRLMQRPAFKKAFFPQN